MIRFEKYHGLGNDFILFEEDELIDLEIKDYAHLAKKVCDRHYGIGADGIIILKYEGNDPYFLYYNSDGSLAPMCGNGIRCFTHFMKNNEKITNNEVLVKTMAGDMYINWSETNEFLVRVNMGKPIFQVNDIINSDTEEYIKKKINIDGKDIELSFLFMGTDHVVIFVDNLDEIDVEYIGKKIENMTEIFPKKTNVNFAQIIDSNNIRVITWERGAGLTQACGTGATAVGVLSNKLGYTNNKMNVELPGGLLNIEFSGDDAFMTGPSEKIAEGKYNFKI